MNYNFDVQFLDIEDRWTTVGEANSLEAAVKLYEQEMQDCYYNGTPMRVLDNNTGETIIEGYAGIVNDEEKEGETWSNLSQ